MRDKLKKAHLMRAREQYDGPPEGFPDFFKNEYVKKYGEEGGKMTNDQVIARYEKMLAATRRGGQVPEQQGLLQAIQKPEKGPYPANEDEDDHLLSIIMKFMGHRELQESIFKTLKSARKNLGQIIAQLSAGIAKRVVSEAKKNRQVERQTELAILRICVEEMWTRARMLGLKKVPKQLVDNNYRVALGIYEQMGGERGQSN